MALHTELPIYRTGVRLLDLAVKAQVQMPRTVIANLLLQRGHVVKGDFTKTYRRTTP